MSYSYTTKISSLKEFLEKIKSKDLGIPDKVTLDYLISIGYKSTNDRPIIRVLKSIGFIDDTGVPTQDFKDFRTEKSEQVMANAIRKIYAELFSTYSNPLARSNQDLENIFASSEPSLKKDTLALYTATFKTLCEFADFATVTTAPTPTSMPTTTPTTQPLVQIPVSKEGGVNITVNITFELPITKEADIYDKIFESLKKHLLTSSSKPD